MSLSYDEILSDNVFGQIIVPAPVSDQEKSPSMTNHSDNKTDEKEVRSLTEQFGFSIDELFNMARHFLKEKQGTKAIRLKYAENVRFVALSKQATIGKWEASHTENVGLLDVVGNDRKQAWIALGNMSKEQAKEEFVKYLLERCPMFQHHLEAHYVEDGEKVRSKKEDETRVLEQQVEQAKKYEHEQVSYLEEQKRKREEFQRKQIQDALNQQTYPQFKAYAEQQYKDNRQAQDDLIRQLQEQHFQQYMQQVYQQQLVYQQQNRMQGNMEKQSETLSSNNQSSSLPPAPEQLPPVVNPPPRQQVTNGTNAINETKVEPTVPVQTQFESLSLNSPLEPPASSNLSSQQFGSGQVNNELSNTQETVDDNSNENDPTINPMGDLSFTHEEGTREYPNIAPANMWTRKDIKEFKEAVRKEKDAVIKIGSGETVTVRVPTHEDGRCIFWEFVTDYYDIGFGLYFEWSKVQSNTVTVHVSDSSEEEEDGEDGINPEKKDIEKGSRSSNKPPKPYQDEIVPIFRRDSHEEVYAGSHPYPGHGVYLLKFDNSYSLWRAKTLYYRVYYSR